MHLAMFLYPTNREIASALTDAGVAHSGAYNSKEGLYWVSVLSALLIPYSY